MIYAIKVRETELCVREQISDTGLIHIENHRFYYADKRENKNGVNVGFVTGYQLF